MSEHLPLRRLIRQMIIEYSDASERQRNAVNKDDLDLKLGEKGKGLTVDQRGYQGIQNKDEVKYEASREQQLDHRIMQLPEFKDATDKRRVLKRWWNDRVYGNSKRSAFFNDPTKVKCVHWVGMYNDHFPALVKKLPKYLETAKTRAPEISCIGYLENSNIRYRSRRLGIEYLERKITFAYAWDAYTEFLSTASKSIQSFFAGSGVPKRPNTSLNAENVMFDERDVKRNHLTKINEVVIDNYSVEPGKIIFHINDKIPEEEKEILEKIIKSDSENHKINYY